MNLLVGLRFKDIGSKALFDGIGNVLLTNILCQLLTYVIKAGRIG